MGDILREAYGCPPLLIKEEPKGIRKIINILKQKIKGN